MRAVVLGVAVLLLSGCASTGKSVELHGSWTLTSMTDAAGTLTPTDHPVTLDFEAGGGRAACNGYTALVTGGPTALHVTNIAQTEMACDPASVMQLESRYLAALSTSTAATSGTDLTITGPGTVLQFARAN